MSNPAQQAFGGGPTRSPILKFYKFITPYWLKNNAKLGFGLETANVSEAAFKIPSDTRKNESLFQLKLMDRGELDDYADITVKLKVGVEYPGPQPRPRPPPRRDPMIFSLWCPREDESMGIQINDYQQFQTAGLGPFRGVEAEASDRGLSDLNILPGRPTQDWYRFPEMYEFTFCPNSEGNIPFASAYAAVDTGTYQTFAPYFKSLRLSRGLNLGIYRDELSEEYIIKSLEISIYENSKDANGK